MRGAQVTLLAIVSTMIVGVPGMSIPNQAAILPHADESLRESNSVNTLQDPLVKLFKKTSDLTAQNANARDLYIHATEDVATSRKAEDRDANLIKIMSERKGIKVRNVIEARSNFDRSSDYRMPGPNNSHSPSG